MLLIEVFIPMCFALFYTQFENDLFILSKLSLDIYYILDIILYPTFLIFNSIIVNIAIPYKKRFTVKAIGLHKL